MIGVISDTHGLLRPEARAALADSELIIHAGDVGNPAVLEALRAIAPVVAVRGNVDTGDWADRLPEYQIVKREGASIYILHDVNQLDIDPAAAGVQAIISGHSHKSSIQMKDGVLYFNPGSAGPRRFKLPITLGHLELRSTGIHASVVVL